MIEFADSIPVPYRNYKQKNKLCEFFKTFNLANLILKVKTSRY